MHMNLEKICPLLTLGLRDEIVASYLGWARKMTMPLMDLVRQVEYMHKPLVYLAHQIQQRHGHTHDATTHFNHRQFEERRKANQEVGQQ